MTKLSYTTRTLPRLLSTLSHIAKSSDNKMAAEVVTVRRILPHIVLVIVIISYMISGAFVFIWLEADKGLRTKYQNPLIGSVDANNLVNLRGNISEMLNGLTDYEPSEKMPISTKSRKEQLNNLLKIWKRSDYSDLDDFFSDNSTDIMEPVAEWQFKNGFLLAFSVVTTIGYGDVTPSTTAGRIFCVIYAVFGIPLCVLGIANIGRFMSDGFLQAYKTLRLAWSNRRISDLESKKKVQYVKELERIPAPILLTVFFSWALLGSLMIPLYEPINAFEACYFVIISLTTVGFGDLVPTSPAFMYVTCLYLAFGLIITTMAIDVLAEYLLKLHYLGKKMKNMGKMAVWLGGRKITVETLFAGVLKELDVSDELFQRALADLDHMVEKTVDEHEAGISHHPERCDSREGHNGALPQSESYITTDLFAATDAEPTEQTALSFSIDVAYIDDDRSSASTYSEPS